MKNNKFKEVTFSNKKPEVEKLHNDKHFASVVSVFPEAFVSGKFCDVKIVCMDTNLWAHRIILGSVSPFLQKLLVMRDDEKQGDDVITLLLPMIKGYHMKLVLDYIYSGAMYLCGAHMQYVIQVMEVLQLKCGVSVNKIVGQGSGEFIEVEHSTVTIKTDHENEQAAKLNGIKDENLSDDAKGNYKLRRKSTSETNISKTKAVKRKRQSDADVENNSIEDKPSSSVIDNNCQDQVKKAARLEITPVANIPKHPLVEETTDKKLDDAKGKVEEKKTAAVTDDEDEGNDVVMVELDEEFVVEQVDKPEDNSDSSASQDETGVTEVIGEPSSSSGHRCVLCGRTFKHYMNLQVHLTGHLGVKVNIHRCGGCRKNFRNKTELDLHLRSHLAARMLAKKKILAPAPALPLKPKVITTSGSADKKIIRKYIKSQDKGLTKKINLEKPKASVSKVDSPQRKVDSPQRKVTSTTSALAKNVENLTCGLCDKSFGVKSLFLRHVRKCHPELAQTLECHSQLKTLPSIKIKKCEALPKPQTKVPSTPKSPQKSPIKSPMRQISTPVTSATSKSSKKKDRRKSESNSSLIPELPNYYNTLECPDCERVFIAKSIFERHLQSAKHGIYGQCNSSQESDGYLSPRTPTVPHWTESPLGLGQTDSGSPHKIECHLCNQSFVRVKDLAKHREKMCQAYHT